MDIAIPDVRVATISQETTFKNVTALQIMKVFVKPLKTAESLKSPKN